MMADTATEPVAAQPSSVSHTNIQSWNHTAIHEMAMNAIIQKHNNSISPAATPTSKGIKSLCIPISGASSSANTILQPSYITVNPSGTACSSGSLPLIATAHGGTQVIQGTPITMSMTQLSELGGASVVQLAPIGYTGSHGNETSLLQAASQ